MDGKVLNQNKKQIFILFVMLAVLLMSCLSGLHSSSTTHLEQAAIDMRYIEFHNALMNGKYDIAYTYMSPVYRKTHTLEEFRSDDFPHPAEDWLTLHQNRLLTISGNKAKLYPGNSKSGLFLSGPEYILVKINEQWYFTGEYEYHLD